MPNFSNQCLSPTIFKNSMLFFSNSINKRLQILMLVVSSVNLSLETAPSIPHFYKNTTLTPCSNTALPLSVNKQLRHSIGVQQTRLLALRLAASWNLLLIIVTSIFKCELNLIHFVKHNTFGILVHDYDCQVPKLQNIQKSLNLDILPC